MASFHYRLLVIDDEPFIRDLFQSSLSTEGYEVGVAKDGFAALAQMRGAPRRRISSSTLGTGFSCCWTDAGDLRGVWAVMGEFLLYPK